MANRLAQESSPYLRQHMNNPVDWYPWGDEALTRAKAENKPILLSVGYSACHWCHVMEHESFENAEIAKQMNENFINIKVDREERPDLDQIYQNVAQLITRSGGWPLTVFLTPDLHPYFGGTYFPPEDRYGRPGFPRVLQALSQAYKSDHASVLENANRLMTAISQLEGTRQEGNKRPDAASLKNIATNLLQSIDWKNGGFGDAPKFPQSMGLTYLWRYGVAADFGQAQEATVLALTKMARGGIYDQLGGGFARYSVDNHWAVPHFEKMLYDNALLLKLYSEVLLTDRHKTIRSEERELFVRVIEETTAYLLREMKSPEGAFYSTQDADSEGEEGKFFAWNPKELANILTADEAAAFLLRYGVTEQGNFEHGRTVLFLDASLDDIASRMKISKEQASVLLANAKKKAFDTREKRIRPHRDEKILASWNGLIISGLSWASRALREYGTQGLADPALQTALTAMQFVRTHMTRDENRLLSVYKDGKARLNAYLDDYAFMAMGALDLARVLPSEHKDEIDGLTTQAKAWIDVVRTHFKDPGNPGFFFTSDDHEKLIQRPKTHYDQAIPSGTAVMVQCLLALGEMFDQAPYATEADEHLYGLFPTVKKMAYGMTELANASLLYVMGPLTVSGKGADQACVHPHAFQKPVTNGQTEILVCHRRACELPLTDPKAARAKVAEKTATI